jgi:hypothetical protein
LKFLYLFFFLPFISINYAQTGGKISGVVYADYFYNIQRDTAGLQNSVLSGSKDLNGFDIRRIYFTYDYGISANFNTRFRLESDGRTLSQNGRYSVFVKDAYIRWKDILPGQDIIFGIQPTPAFEYSEAVYGFRSLEKTLMDLRGFVSSREFGVSLRGRITNDFGYWFQFGNNAGTSPETDKYKRIYMNLNYKFAGNFISTVYGDIRFRPAKSPLTGGESLKNNVITAAYFIGYIDPSGFSGGSELVYQVYQNELTGNRNKQSGGLSLFGSYNFSELVTFTARADLFDPALNEDIEFDRRNLYIIGLSFKPDKQVSIIPNLMVESFEDIPEREISSSVSARVTLFYEF